MERNIPELDMADYKKRVNKEYRAIVARTPGIGKMKDNMFVMTMYAGAFLIALYKEAKDYMSDELLTCKRSDIQSDDGQSKTREKRFYGKGDSNSNEAVKMVQRPYRRISDELVLFF